MDPEEFAASRGERLATADAVLRPLVAAALASGDWSALVDEAAELWLDIFTETAPDAYVDAALRGFRKELLAALERTSMPEGEPDETQIERVTRWTGTFTAGNSEYQGAFASGNRQKRWITRSDDRVRESHAAVAGQVAPIGGTFNVGGYKLHYPGEPVGPPEVWIECRCILQGFNKRRTIGMSMIRAAATAPEELPAIIVALPAADDPVNEYSTEQPHVTLAYLGTALDPEVLESVKVELQRLVEQIGMPVTEQISGRGILGPNGADILLIDAAALAPAHEILTATDTVVGELALVADTFPTWIPHLTVGYPDAPAEGEYAATEITFDRLALWAGEDQTEYPLGETMSPKTAPASATAAVEAPPAPVEVDEEPLIDDEVDIPIYGVAAPINVLSGDGRRFTGEVKWRDLPLPVMFQRATADGHDGAERAGRIDEMWIDPETQLVRWKGVAKNNPAGMEMIEGIVFGDVRSVSVDLGDLAATLSETEEVNGMPVQDYSMVEIAGLTAVGVGAFREAFIAIGEEDCGCDDDEDQHPESVDGETVEDADEELFALIEAAGIIDLTELSAEQATHYESLEGDMDAQLAYLEQVAPQSILAAGSFAPGTKDGPGWITHPIPTGRIRRYWTHGKGAAKIRWGAPGDFNRCRRQLAKYIKNPDWLAGACANMHKEVLGVWPGRERGDKHSLAEMAPSVILASGAPPEFVPRSFFDEPPLELTALTVTDEGRIYGYLAEWSTCHIGMDGVCTNPPFSTNDYAYFRTGVVDTDEGPVRTGGITMGIGHASSRISKSAATAHYDQPNSVVADVAVGENALGIWFSGVLREGVTDAQIREFKATAKLSGDWRGPHDQLELIGATVVNVAGFPVPQLAIAASGGHQTALIAAGIVQVDTTPASAITATQLVKMGMIEAVADEIESRAAKRERVAAVRAREAAVLKPARVARIKQRVEG